ncbi:UDP-N-acetyl-D-mannosamine dehydrogenase [bacterium]|jgi:UDP-N-acetyl-D-mannosaminuronic acid dehydrogenase|nr:UDP-N-acetyl-D-mannosamine dehydrogenase [bacterium]MBT3581940.1 UDP-N-acetyl-D-mannosamine dehydrogenase [bacterium]MBT4551707.1 UDP-N-acetyl-D-mannosamine dehydrogenase [bacterium]MBT7088563.1 UDP-N-acetyl-D-mannosamine dehydrogenase [bacterium]
MEKKVCVLGLGYIGLPTASILANKGYDVLGVDVSKKIVDTINRGEIHIVEPDLDVLVKSAVNSGQLTASLNPASADIFYICVPTPFKEDHKPDISYVISATESILPYVKKGNLVILESTSPPKTTLKVAEILKKTGFAIGEEVFVAHAPERVLPGKILHEAIYNDRIIGGINDKSAQICQQFYKTFVQGNIYVTDSVTAEMAKLCENSFRDVNIAFANELSMIADKLEIDVWELIDLANKHPRVNILKPGPGVGGHCLAVDPWFIVDAVPKETKLIRTAREINDFKPDFILGKIKQAAAKFKKPVIGCLGLAYKPDIDDLRESPAKVIVQKLLKEKVGEILVCEPNVKEDEVESMKLSSLVELMEKADIVVGLVGHKEFREMERSVLAEKIVIDACGMWEMI